MTVKYIWDVLELAGDDATLDVQRHHFCDTLTEAVAIYRCLPDACIELVRDVNDKTRRTAMVENYRLPREFIGGWKVPERFHIECSRVWPKGYQRPSVQ